ncbi:acrosomal protein KIAA1210 homolog [Saccopteryx bilineata]|uniref:acrosomal protein KIAA1210 homolog n=1 Tax=Saccopteryx bilineata TaxID=59482 RepID=UPI00338FCE6F
MAESLEGASGNLEVLETSDEGKKKSRLRALKNFFVKKKKKPEYAQGGRRLRSNSPYNISHSSARLIQRVRRSKSLTQRSISHDNILMGAQPERQARKLYPSPELERGRSMEISHLSSGRRAVSASPFAVMPHYEARSGTWVAGAKITEIQPLRPCQPSISQPLMQPDTICKDFGEMSLDFESPETQRKKALAEKLTLRKVKPEEKGTSFQLTYEKKSHTKPKTANQRKPRKDSTGPSSQEQINKTDIYETIDIARSQAYSQPAAYGRQSGKKGLSASGKSEFGPRRKSSKQSSQRLGLPNIAGSPPADKIAEDSPLWLLPSKKQARVTTPRELLSEKNDMERRNVGLNREVGKAWMPHPIPKDTKGSMVSGQSQYHEDRASGTRKLEARATLLPMVESPSTTHEGAIFAVAGEAQACMDPSHVQSKEEDAFSYDSQNVQFKVESVHDSSTICKQKSPGNVGATFTATALDMERALAQEGISVERLPPRSLFWSSEELAAKNLSVSDSVSEVERVSEQQLAPGNFLQSLGRSEDEVFADSENASEEGNGSEEQLDPRCVSQDLGEHEYESVSYFENYDDVKGWSSSEEDLPPRHSPLVSREPEDQQEVSSVPKKTQEQCSISVEQIAPRNLPQPFEGTLVQQQHSTCSLSASSEWLSVPPRPLPQSWLNPESQQQASAFDWDISMEPVPSRMSSKHWKTPTIQHPIPSVPQITATQGVTSIKLQPPGNHSQPPVKPIEQEISAGPENMAAERSISMEPLPPEGFVQPLMNPNVEQNRSLGSASAENVISKEQPFSKYCPECLANAQTQRIFTANSLGKSVFVELLLPECSCQAMGIACDQGSASAEWSCLVKPIPLRRTRCPCVGTDLEQQPSASSESIAVAWDIPGELLPPQLLSQLSVKPVAEQEVSPESAGAPAERSGLVEPVPPRHTSPNWMAAKFEQEASAGPESTVAEQSVCTEPLPPRKPSQPLMKPVVKQPTSAGPETVAIKGDISTEMPSPRPCSIVRHKIHQMTSTVENAAVERPITGRPLSAKYPTDVLIKSQVQEMPSENTAVERSMSKESQHPRRPSQSFVKFMAQNVFSENPDTEEQVYVNPLPSNQPSNSSLKPKAERPFPSDWERPDDEGGISSTQQPVLHPLPPLEIPEYPPEVFSSSENMKWKHPQEKVPPRHLSEEQLPSRCPSQVEDEAEFQQQMFSASSVSVPVGRSSAEDHLLLSQSSQAFSNPEYQQQVYSSSTSAATEGTIFEGNPSSWDLPSGPAISNESRKHGQGSEDLSKNIPTPATKPGEDIVTPACPASTSGGTYSKEEVLQIKSESNVSTSEADIENVFGVRLKRVPPSQKFKSEKQNLSTRRPPVSSRPVSSSLKREPQSSNASQGLLAIAENLPTTSDFAEKEQSKPKSDSMPKKQPAYNVSGKAAGKQSGYATSEPAWTTATKESQRNFPAQVPVKEPETKNKPGEKTEIEVLRYGEAGLPHQDQQGKTSTSSIKRQEIVERMKISESTKAVGSENEKTFQAPTVKKDTKQSSSHPVTSEEPFEPVWFSMAKKKAKAWSQISELLQ